MKGKIFLIVECIMLLLFGTMGYQLYKMELRTYQNSYQAEKYQYLEKLTDQYVTDRYCMEQGIKPFYNKSPDKVVYDFMNNYRVGDTTYIIAKCYDKNFKLVAEGGDMIYLQENQELGIKDTYIYPDLYFSEEQLQKIYDFNETYGNTMVSRIEGYYKGEQFILTALRVEQTDEENRGVYVEIRNEGDHETITYDRDQVSIFGMFLKTGANVRPVKYEFTGPGSLGYYLAEKFEQGRADTLKQYNEEQYKIHVLKTAVRYKTEWLEGTTGIARTQEFLYNGETYYLQYSIITDLPYDAFVDSGLVFYSSIIFFFLQLVAIFLSIVFYNTVKKQKRLEQAKVVLTNGVAHELKTPIAVIKNYGECIREQVNTQKNEYYLESILGESDRMNAMVVQMLQYIRYSNDTYRVKKELVSLEEITIEVLKEKEPIIKQRELNVSIDCKGSTEVLCDGELVKLVIENYLSNAIQYTKKKGKIRISLVVSRNKFTSKIGYYIWNEGTILTKEEQDVIWDVYYRGDKARTRSNNSTGFGLAICKHIIKLHNGKYGCFDVEDGMVFYFELKRRR